MTAALVFWTCTVCTTIGDTDRSGEQHTRQTGHATITGTDPETLAAAVSAAYRVGQRRRQGRRPVSKPSAEKAHTPIRPWRCSSNSAPDPRRACRRRIWLPINWWGHCRRCMADAYANAGV